MDISKVTISCTKSDCSGRSPLHHSHCNICGTPVLKRYLYVLASPKVLPVPNTFLADRYLVTEVPNIVLDTQPHCLAIVTEEIPSEIEAYLRLSTYQLHMPKVFGLTSGEKGYWFLADKQFSKMLLSHSSSFLKRLSTLLLLSSLLLLLHYDII